jgi:hypothetical protein
MGFPTRLGQPLELNFRFSRPILNMKMVQTSRLARVIPVVPRRPDQGNRALDEFRDGSQ